MGSENMWRRCSACKQPIALGASYYVCSVSTCNQKRTALAFCDVSCWEVHLPVARHRKAWALDRQAPRTREAPAAAAPPRAPRRSIARATARTPAGASAPASPSGRPEDAPREVLIIASRLKEYVRKRCGFNTSERVLDPLSDIVREVVDEAIRSAARDERKTVLDRDVPKPRRGSR